MMRGIPALAASLLLALAMVRADAADVAKGQKVFHLCMACHRIGPGAGTLIGPELNGVVGRKAGSLTGYPFSDAMKNSGLTWDEATLTKYLRGPRLIVPGTRMTFAGLSKDD